MKRKLIKALYSFSFHLKIWKMHSFFFQKNRITVLLFHDLNPQKFDLVFSTLEKHYNIIDFNEFDQIMQGKSKLKPYSVLITFDDGRLRNMELIDKLIAKKIRPLLFLSTHVSRLDGDKFIQFSQIKEISRAFDIGAHTHTHPELPTLTAEQIKEEITTSKSLLENELNTEMTTFAFPYGLYSDNVIDACAPFNFKYLFNVDPGYNIPGKTHKDYVKRVCVSDNPTEKELYFKMTGLYDLLFRKKGEI